MRSTLLRVWRRGVLYFLQNTVGPFEAMLQIPPLPPLGPTLCMGRAATGFYGFPHRIQQQVDIRRIMHLGFDHESQRAASPSSGLFFAGHSQPATLNGPLLWFNSRK